RSSPSGSPHPSSRPGQSGRQQANTMTMMTRVVQRIMRRSLSRAGAALLGIALAAACGAPQQGADAGGSGHYDILLRNGRIVDGTGNPWYTGDVAIRGDVIVAVAPAIAGTAERVIDV